MIDDSSDLTIACLLRPAELGDRRAVWQGPTDHALRELRPVPQGVRLVYAASEEVEGQLRELVRLKAHCCYFADWRVCRSGEELILDVTSPGDGAAAVRGLFNVC